MHTPFRSAEPGMLLGSIITQRKRRRPGAVFSYCVVYNCGRGWGEVVYTIGVVGDSGIL